MNQISGELFWVILSELSFSPCYIGSPPSLVVEH